MILQKIRKAILDGDLYSAIDELEQSFGKSVYSNEVTLLKFRLNQIESDMIKGVMSNELHSLSKNQLVDSIVNFVSKVDFDVEDEDEVDVEASVVLSFIGLLNSGKTVYISQLFNELENNDIAYLDTLDSFTIKKMNFLRDLISKGRYPQGTKATETSKYQYRLNFNSKLKKEFNDTNFVFHDFSGVLSMFRVCNNWEDYEKLEWFYERPNFAPIFNSDIVFLTIDSIDFFKDDPNGCFQKERIQRNLISCLQALLSNKYLRNENQDFTVGLLFTKCDGYDDHTDDRVEVDKKYLIEESRVLIEFCQRRFSRFEYFFVSSIERQMVVEPFIWAIENRC